MMSFEVDNILIGKNSRDNISRIVTAQIKKAGHALGILG